MSSHAVPHRPRDAARVREPAARRACAKRRACVFIVRYGCQQRERRKHCRRGQFHFRRCAGQRAVADRRDRTTRSASVARRDPADHAVRSAGHRRHDRDRSARPVATRAGRANLARGWPRFDHEPLSARRVVDAIAAADRRRARRFGQSRLRSARTDSARPGRSRRSRERQRVGVVRLGRDRRRRAGVHERRRRSSAAFQFLGRLRQLSHADANGRRERRARSGRPHDLQHLARAHEGRRLFVAQSARGAGRESERERQSEREHQRFAASQVHRQVGRGRQLLSVEQQQQLRQCVRRADRSEQPL
ncbi:hypothetical protein OKW33_002169 [Paraburkholderia atlantica]